MRVTFRPLFLCALAGTLVSLSANVNVRLDTPVGSMTIELYDEAKPVTVTNFLRYVRDGLYDTTIAHRLPQGFVLQGGAINADADGDLFYIPTYPAITNEAGPFPQYSNVKGTIAMALSGTDQNSATGSWFINLKNNNGADADNLDTLNGGFTVFGAVTSGFDVLNRFAAFSAYANADGTDLIIDLSGGNPSSPLATLPITKIVNSSWNTDDFIFTTWTILDSDHPVITSPSWAAGAVGEPFSYQTTATNSSTSFSIVTGTLPDGLFFDATTGLISGTPTGTSNSDLVIRAAGAGGHGGAALNITIAEPEAPVVTSEAVAVGALNKPFGYQITADNHPASFSISDGSLPSGLSLDEDSGLISGTPTAAGSTTVTMNATNAGGTGSLALTITIAATAPQPPSSILPSIATKNKVTGSSGKVMLEGSSSPGTVKVEVKTGKGGFKRAKGSPAHWKFPVKNLKPGKYKFKVRATDARGHSTLSTVKAVIKN